MPGDGLSGFPVDLQRSENPFGVGGMELSGGSRVHFPELFQQRLDSSLLQLPLQLPANRAAGGARSEAPSRHHGVQIEPRTAYQHRELVSAQDVLDALVRRLDESGCGPVFAGPGDGDHVVGDALCFFRCRGGGADGHTLVDLHGVHTDHLAVEAFGQEDAHFRFAAGGGTGNAEDFI